MPETKPAVDDSAKTPSSAAPEVNAAPPASEEDSVEKQVKEILGDIPVVSEEEPKPEDKPEATPPVEKKGDEVPEKEKEEAPKDEKPAEVPVEKVPEPNRLDNRIAKLFLENKLLRGEEGDLPSLEDVAKQIQSYSFSEKRDALNRLLSERKTLRGGQDDGVVDFSEEDHEALVEAEADRRFQEMQEEISRHEWQEDLVKTVEAHPELDERKPEYKPNLAVAVEKLVKRGMKCSDALQTVSDAIASAKTDEDKSSEIEKQKLLSGAVGASNENVAPKGELTWDELAIMQVEDPDRYLKIVQEGNLPKD